MNLQKIIIILLISSGIPAFAQKKDSVSGVIKKGALGLQLNVNSDFSSNNFIGGNLGLKYFVSRHFSVRGGFSVNNSSNELRDSASEHHMRMEKDSSDRREHTHLNSTAFGVNAYVSYYPLTKGKFSFYVGAGGMYNFLVTPKQFTFNGTTVSNNTDKKIGIGGLLGTEYKALDNLSVFLEYNPVFLFETNNKQIEEVQGGIEELRGLREVNLQNVNLGVTYYFK